MAGNVRNDRIANCLLSLWPIYVLLSFIIICLSSCKLPQSTAGGPAYTVSPEQKKVELQEKLKRDFRDSQTHFLLGQLYHADRAWDDAEYEYNRALQFGPAYMPAQASMIKLYTDKGDAAKSKNYLDIYMNQAGEMPDKLVELARELQKQQADTYALTCFYKALEIAPKSANVHKYLGYFYLNKNEKEKASEHFQESFKIDSSQHDVARELGKLGIPVVYDARPPETKQQPTNETPK
jgi:tetratricopeptide (TPR) repeat protein